MEQSGNYSNNLQIGHAGSRNAFNISQTVGAQSFIQLEVEQNSVLKVNKKNLQRDRLLFIFKLIGGSMVGAFAFIADAAGISQFLNIPIWWLLPVGMFIGVFFSLQHYRSCRILSRLPKDGKGANYIGDNLIAEEDIDSRIISLYERSAPCIYPKCQGKIMLYDAPPREKISLGRDFVGICSICGKEHSYRLDSNWVAYPQQFDWRSVENNK